MRKPGVEGLSLAVAALSPYTHDLARGVFWEQRLAVALLEWFFLQCALHTQHIGDSLTTSMLHRSSA
jgi:hypothetical protein